MNGHCDDWSFSCPQTLQKGALSIVDAESMLAISDNDTSVGVVHESIAVMSLVMPEGMRFPLSWHLSIYAYFVVWTGLAL